MPGAMNKQNSRQKRSHERKRARYRSRIYGVYTRLGPEAPRLGRKLRKRARNKTLKAS